MKQMRSHAIARRRFLGNGARMDEGSWAARRSTIVAELQEDLPSLRTLSASRLEVVYEVADRFVIIEALLVESPQLTLWFGNRQKVDPFREELNRVQADQSGLRESYEWALKSLELPTTNEVVSRRQFLWKARKTGQIEVCSSQVTEWLDVPPLPRVMQQALELEIKARVIRMALDEIRVELLEPVLIDTTQLIIVPIGKRIDLTRIAQLTGLDAAHQLSTAIETRQAVLIRVLIELSWVDGQPHRLIGTDIKLLPDL